MSIEVMKQALETLEYLHTEKCDYMRRKNLSDPLRAGMARLAIPAISTLRQAIAEAEKQEPHSWYSAEHDEWMTNKTHKEHEALNSYTHKVGGFDLPLYTTPPQREWVGLTDEEIEDCYREGGIGKAARLLKEKNHG
jgi:hypothetical protein